MDTDYPVEIETTSKPFAEYRTPEYAELDLPMAPAIMVGDEIIVEGSDLPEEELVSAIREELGMPPVEPQKKGFLGRLFDK